ncbi:MAG: DUF4298 domain-containing protein [Oscillospiraceae bacterium]|nr:DUF4298 domain-containing protein [Oscillospiraceae bacterium]
MMIQEATERIRLMEQYFQLLQNVEKENPAALREDPSVKAMLQMLTGYYESGQWLRDYELDEKGLLPRDLKRGVLSQDAVYHFLDRIGE